MVEQHNSSILLKCRCDIFEANYIADDEMAVTSWQTLGIGSMPVKHFAKWRMGLIFQKMKIP